MKREVITRAPARIDLAGGWTDVPPYCDREGGFVCNIAITRYATARLGAADAAAASVGHPATDEPLVRAVLARGGVPGICATLENDFPVSAGLGGSSAASAALLAGLATWRGEPWKRADIAEEGRRVEVEALGIAGGRQDHYAATYGGALALTFTTGVSVRRIPLPDTTRAAFVRRSLLIYTGVSRISGDTITAVLGAYESGDARVAHALARMREIARDMSVALEGGDLDAVGALLSEHWIHQRSLHPSIPTARIDEIVERAHTAGALGAKAMGASGGGCVLVVASADGMDRVRSAVEKLGRVIDFGLDSGGVTVVGDSR